LQGALKPKQVARTADFAVRVSSVAIIAAVPYSAAVSKLQRAFLSDRYFPCNEYAGMSPDEQNERCGLIVERVRMLSYPRTRI